MKGKLIFITALAVSLAGCVTDEERVAQMAAADDAACRAVPADQYNACRAQRIQYRQLAAQQEAAESARLAELGQRLQHAGAALQSINPPSPTMMAQPSMGVTNCQNLGGTLHCQSF
jgi:hypothetical protein